MPDRLQRRDLMHVWHIEDQVLDSCLAKIFAHLDHVVGTHALRTEIDAAQGSALYFRVVPPHVLAVAPQDLQLVPDRTRSPVGEEVASIGVLRYQPQGLLLAHASDHDGRMRPAQCRWVVHGFLEAIVFAAIRLDLPDHIWWAIRKVSSSRSKRSAVVGNGT